MFRKLSIVLGIIISNSIVRSSTLFNNVIVNLAERNLLATQLSRCWTQDRSVRAALQVQLQISQRKCFLAHIITTLMINVLYDSNCKEGFSIGHAASASGADKVTIWAGIDWA